MTKTKVCGLTREEDIQYVNELKPDYMGFVFAAGRRQISIAQAIKLKKLLRPDILSVGVFVDAPYSVIELLVKEAVIDLIQLHGSEDADDIRQIKEQLTCPVIKAVRVKNTRQIQEAAKLPADYLLLDTYVTGLAGGSGTTFDWNLIPPETGPFFLAGGLGPHNVAAAIKSCRPYCVDVSSGVETNGIKDYNKIAAFLKAAREEN